MKNSKIGVTQAFKAGRGRRNGHNITGKVIHYVDSVPFGTALCGAETGFKSLGWAESKEYTIYKGNEIVKKCCKKCKKLLTSEMYITNPNDDNMKTK